MSLWTLLCSDSCPHHQHFQVFSLLLTTLSFSQSGFLTSFLSSHPGTAFPILIRFSFSSSGLVFPALFLLSVSSDISGSPSPQSSCCFSIHCYLTFQSSACTASQVHFPFFLYLLETLSIALPKQLMMALSLPFFSTTIPFQFRSQSLAAADILWLTNFHSSS